MGAQARSPSEVAITGATISCLAQYALGGSWKCKRRQDSSPTTQYRLQASPVVSSMLCRMSTPHFRLRLPNGKHLTLAFSGTCYSQDHLLVSHNSLNYLVSTYTFSFKAEVTTFSFLMLTLVFGDLWVYLFIYIISRKRKGKMLSHKTLC